MVLFPPTSAPGAAVLILLSLGVGGTWGQSPKPDFCSEVEECFTFRALCNTTEYEARLYPPSVWVGTHVTASYTRARLTGFWRLLSYIQGQNEDGVKLEMTAPVITKVPLGHDVEKEYTIYFLLPQAFHQAPPVPTSSDVFLSSFPHMVLYVRSFGGWIMNSNRDSNFQALAASLEQNAESFNPTYYYTAGYNSAMKLFNRHNEIWFRGLGEPSCESMQE
ncbi:heme-binding protein 2-like [Lissotriton helveticus]